MARLGAMMAGGNRTDRGRQDGDFYPTPDEVTQAIVPFVPRDVGLLWEPCCGNGAMADALKGAGLQVVSSDINPRDDSLRLDFLSAKSALGGARGIITNPPFNLAPQMIERALTLDGVGFLALVLKSTFWHATRRRALWTRFRPAMVLPLTWRPDFLGLGAPTMEVMWCVWDDAHMGPTLYRPLDRPPPGA